MIAARLAEITWKCAEGNYASLAKTVRASGGTFEVDKSSGPVARTSQMTVGISRGDPISVFVSVAFALAGPLWVNIPEFAEAMKLIRREWSARTKAARK